MPLTLGTCDGTPYEFYNAETFCDFSFTVVSIAAGWSGPSRRDASLMQDRLVDLYAPYAVRVVTALIADNDGAAPDQAFCDGWVELYELTNPVLIDSGGDTQIYFPGDALPANLIVDSTGTIIHRDYGASDDFATIQAVLDDRLGLGP